MSVTSTSLLVFDLISNKCNKSDKIWTKYDKKVLVSDATFSVFPMHMHQNCLKIWLTKPNFWFFDHKWSKSWHLGQKCQNSVIFCYFRQEPTIFNQIFRLSIQFRYSLLSKHLPRSMVLDFSDHTRTGISKLISRCSQINWFIP